MIVSNKKTKASVVLNKLRQDLVQGLYSPGSKLQMDDLKKRYKVGYSPLREALFQLTHKGLITIEEHCGFTVTPLSIDCLRDLYQTRMNLEIQALELALVRGDDKWEADVIAKWHLFSKYLQSDTDEIDTEKWNSLQTEYYNTLIGGCRSPWLIKVIDSLFDQSERYRYACVHSIKTNKTIISEYVKYNDQLVTAILKRDKHKLNDVLKKIWNQSLKTIEAALKL